MIKRQKGLAEKQIRLLIELKRSDYQNHSYFLCSFTASLNKPITLSPTY